MANRIIDAFKQKCYLLIAISISTQALHASSEVSSLYAKNYTVADGLSDNYSECVYTDREGLLWIATHHGLCFFDGYEFKQYVRSANDSSGLTDNFIYCIYEGSDRTLWVGTFYGGLFCFDRKIKRFEKIVVPGYGPVNATVRSITEDFEGNIWIGTYEGLFRIDFNGISAKQYFVTNSEVQKSGMMIESVIVSGSGVVLVGVRAGKSLYAYSKERDTFELFPDLPGNIAKGEITCLTEDLLGRIWVGTAEDGIAVFDPSKEKWVMYDSENGTIPSDEILSLYCDRAGTVWFGMINSGLGVCNSDGQFEFYGKRKFGFNPIPSTSISGITQDQEGNYWLSSHGSGVYQCRKENGGFSYVSSLQMNRMLEKKTIVSCFEEDNFGTIWVGTDGDGLYKYDRLTGAFQPFNSEARFHESAILSMASRGDKIWLGGWNLGLCSMAVASDEVMYYEDANRSYRDYLKRDKIKSLYIDSVGTLWCGNNTERGVTVWGTSTLNISQELNADCVDKLSGVSWVNEIVGDNRGYMWIATDRGLYRYKTDLDKFTVNKDIHLSIASNYVSTVHQDSKGNLWVGTNEGLLLFDYAEESFLNYSYKYNLPLDIRSILDDGRKLWVATENGLLCFDTEKKTSEYYNSYSGLERNSFFERSCLKTKDGTMFFGGADGFVSFSPSDVKPPKDTPSIVLTDFSIFNDSRFCDVKMQDSGLCKYAVSIPYNASVFSFEYAAVSYWSSTKNNYAYMLVGFDADWHNVGGERKATYTNLDPGDYYFHVKGAGSNGVWNDVGMRVRLTIKPPIWLTLWFRFSLGIVAVSLFALFYIWKMRNYERQKAKLEAMVKHRTHELKYLNNGLIEQKEEILLQKEQLIAQKRMLEESNDSLLRQTGEIILQREQIIGQNRELERKNKELDQLIKMKDKFFSIIAHDLKNPVNAIMGFSELMLRRFKSINDAKKIDFVSHINLSANLVYNLLVNLLDWARTQTHNLQVKKKKYQLNNIVADTVLLMADLAKSKDISLKMDVRDEIWVYTDVNLIKTVLRNLISNAIKFTERRGTVLVQSTISDGDEVVITVQDNGVGMSEEKVSTLFDVGKNTSTNGTEHEQGTGLGLLVVKEFVQVSGGRIWVESKAGKGTSFFFTVPQGQESTISVS